jgi:DNA-directed RNA polymerase specialized sigma24 family protein
MAQPVGRPRTVTDPERLRALSEAQGRVKAAEAELLGAELERDTLLLHGIHAIRPEDAARVLGVSLATMWRRVAMAKERA